MPVTLSKKRVLYPNASWYFALGIITTWLGFSKSYFGQLGQTDIYHHIHGATAGLWMALLIVQPILYKKGHLELHRKLGRIASVILIPMLILGGIKMMHMMMQNQVAYPPGVTYRLAYIDVCSILMFLLFFGLSLWHSKKLDIHARYMACTILVLLPPAITRMLFLLPWFNSFDKTLNGSFIAVELVLLLLLFDDKRGGKIRNPYKIALLLFILLHVSMNFAGNWLWWKSTMDNFTALKF